MIITGAVVTLAGLALLCLCMVKAFQAKKSGLEGEELVQKLRGIIPINLGALLLSSIGLMLVVLGIFVF